MSNRATDQWSRQSTQKCLKQFDWYANPVTLTYNQQKKFTTVNGAICSVISQVLLLYLIVIAILNYVLNPTFVHTFEVYTLSPYEPSAFKITQDQLLVMT